MLVEITRRPPYTFMVGLSYIPQLCSLVCYHNNNTSTVNINKQACLQILIYNDKEYIHCGSYDDHGRKSSLP